MWNNMNEDNMTDKKMKFSGDKEGFESGATREVKKGRGLPALIYPGLLERLSGWLVEQNLSSLICPELLDRLSKWMELGAENHSLRNWEQGIPSESYLNSLYRHTIIYQQGDRSEDHLAAILFNTQGLIYNQEVKPELDKVPTYGYIGWEFKEWIKIEDCLTNEEHLEFLYQHLVAYHRGGMVEDHLAAIACAVQGLILSEVEIRGEEDFTKIMKEALKPPVEAVLDKPTRIGTSTGGSIDPINPDLEDIVLEDIFKGLSSQVRYTGQLKKGVDFYSVAQHSVLMALWAESDGEPFPTCLAILMHDFPEAYLSDISSPIKQTPELAGYRKIEALLTDRIYTKFMGGPVSKTVKDLIKHYDLFIGAQEIQYLMEPSPVFDPWIGNVSIVAVPHFITVALNNPWSIGKSRAELETLFSRYMRSMKPWAKSDNWVKLDR